MNRLSILVTGGGGFIGSNIAGRLTSLGHSVVVTDWFGSSEKWRNLSAVALADVVLPDQLPALLARHDFDAVVHMGAISATTERDVDLILRTNVALSCDILDYCVRRNARLIYASSAATYGDGTLGFQDESTVAALSPFQPLNAYGWSKKLFDLILARRREDNLPLPAQCVGLKFFNVFGPNEYHKGDMRSVVIKIFEQIQAKQPVTLFESYRDGIPHGGQMRDFIYVRDCVDVVSWFIDNPEVSGLFNVGTGQARSFIDLANAVFAALGRKPLISFIEMPEPLRRQYQYFTEAKMERLRNAGYLTAFSSLESAVSDYVTNYLCEHKYSNGQF